MTETETNPDQEFRVFRYPAWVGSESFDAWEVQTVALFRSWLEGYREALGVAQALHHGERRGGLDAGCWRVVEQYCATCERWFHCEGAVGLRAWSGAHDHAHDPLPLEVAPNAY
jgi:hypothetical protein